MYCIVLYRSVVYCIVKSGRWILGKRLALNTTALMASPAVEFRFRRKFMGSKPCKNLVLEHGLSLRILMISHRFLNFPLLFKNFL